MLASGSNCAVKPTRLRRAAYFRSLDSLNYIGDIVTFEELEQEVAKMKGRATADLAFLRCALFTLSTAQLRGAELAMSPLAEELAVKLLNRADVSDPANHAYEDRKEFWLEALRAEIAARDSVGRQ